MWYMVAFYSSQTDVLSQPSALRYVCQPSVTFTNRVKQKIRPLTVLEILTLKPHEFAEVCWYVSLKYLHFRTSHGASTQSPVIT